MTERISQDRRKAGGAQLSFCTNCHVSIAQAEFDAGSARRTPTGNVWCTLCTRAGADGRRRRRAVLEEEFADDAPIPAPRPSNGRPPSPAAKPRGPTLEQRVGHLERTVFRLQARVEELEERLGER